MFRRRILVDDKDVPVYSFNEVIAYAVSDENDRIVDLEVDILELITPNHDGAEDNYLGMWPGQSYNLDADGKVDGELTETEDEWMAQYAQFRTKRAIDDVDSDHGIVQDLLQF